MVNYVEGQVDLNGQQLTSRAVGSAQVGNGEVLETQNGKVEILLTPGVLLRLGNGSALRMDSPGLTDTRVALLRGEAMVEVTQLFKENHLEIADQGATALLVKKGLYEFDPNRVAVFDGEAKVTEGDKQVTVKKGKDLPLTSGTVKAVSFDRNVHDDLYAWSNLRSEYLSQAAIESARAYIVNPYGFYGAGWYWNPWFGMYSFLPGSGFLYSPFGWGFFSPGFAYYAPVVGYHGYPGRVVTGIAARNRVFASRPALGMSRGFAAPAMHSFGGGGRTGGGHR
jgi:hypothetical protein